MQTINGAMKSRDPMVKKGAEMMLALAPNILIRAPNAAKRQIKHPSKMDDSLSKILEWTFY